MAKYENIDISPQEAITVIRGSAIRTARGIGKTIFTKAIQVAFEALERRIPKKPIKKEKNSLIAYLNNTKNPIIKHCPTCDKMLSNVGAFGAVDMLYKYCPDCGQAIDWGDENA